MYTTINIIKNHEDIKTPEKMTANAASYTLFAPCDLSWAPGEERKINTGLWLQAPPFFGTLFLSLPGSPLLCAPIMTDFDTTGEIELQLRNSSGEFVNIEGGDEMAAFCLVPFLTYDCTVSVLPNPPAPRDVEVKSADEGVI